MNCLRCISGLIIILIHGGTIAMQKRLTEKIRAQAEEKLAAKRELQKDIIRIRNIKRQHQAKLPAKALDKKSKKNLNRKFRKIFKRRNIDEIEKFLVHHPQMNLNEPIKYNTRGNFVYELAIITAAIVFSDLEMVKIFIKYGAKTNLPDESLSYKVLDTINENEEKIMTNDLAILFYLLKFCNFNNKDQEKCAEIWAHITERVKNKQITLEMGALVLFYSISDQFFPNI